MKIFITGATGHLGSRLAIALADQGHLVHALSHARPSSSELLQHPNIKIFQGDVTVKETLLPAMKGCQQVYHTAGKAGAWSKRTTDFDDINVKGTAMVFNAANQAGIERMVFISSASVFGPSDNDPLNEAHQRILPLYLDYDRTKKMAEDYLMANQNRTTNIVIVAPVKVFGPGRPTNFIAANNVISNFLSKGITVVPAPGTYKVCFAYIDDVVNGCIQAMEKGRVGEKYILGGHNISYIEFFETFRRLSGKKARILTVPKPLMKTLAYAQGLGHMLFGTNIHLNEKAVQYIYSNYIFSSEKARQELGYTITPFEEGAMETIKYLAKKNMADSN
ncbi:MAG TPA: NAD-dependent epimerase/dehydratase family protein [Phnomibacter sp.]|nr:NAD-dependent epimerase/dehydratase family protein [Phnomibacter sp.]